MNTPSDKTIETLCRFMWIYYCQTIGNCTTFIDKCGKN